MKKNISIAIATTALAAIVSIPGYASAQETKFEPAWIQSEKSPLKYKTSTTTSLSPFIVKIPPNTRMSGHQGWSEAKLKDFAILHTNLIAKLERTYPSLESIRDTLIVRINAAKGDVTEATMHMDTAKERMETAKKLIEELKGYTPPVLNEPRVASTTLIKLEHPRTIGKEAIDAMKEAKAALHKVIASLAKEAGFDFDKDGKIVPRPN